MLSKKYAYYNYDKLFSYNATYNFVVGARGLGKTYGAKLRVIKNALRTDEQFIYLRRFKTELRGRGTFFADIAHEFPDWEFRVNGHIAEASPVDQHSPDGKRLWKQIGYFVSLSNAQAQKSVAYPRVTMIIFDEFIIEKGTLHYLPEEAKAFNDFYSTVDRWQDKTRVLFLANALTITNPYFLEYDIKPSRGNEIIRKADGFLLVHLPDSEQFGKQVLETKFGKFIADTEYAAYSVASEFHDNHDRMLAPKPSEARYYCTIETTSGIFSVWVNFFSDPTTYYVQEKRPKVEKLFTFIAQNMDNDLTLLTSSDKITQYLRTAYRHGRTYFDTPKARNAFIELFKR